MKRYVKTRTIENDVIVEFEITAFNNKTGEWEVTHTLRGEFEITDDQRVCKDEYRAYLLNAQMMLYIVFEGEEDEDIRFLRQVCLARFAAENDITAMF